ncbi:MAG: leader peptide processing enzyme [Treponema sp.]|nr:leader peptide processing enzyme [Treponema sp.]
MNKRLNTIFFILGATAFNVLVAVVSFILLTLVYARFIMTLVPDSGRAWGFTLIFLASLAISFLVYRYVLKYFLNKVDVEKYFDPLFVKRNLKKN